MTKISFELWGLTLLEPMALVLNWIMCIQAVMYYLKLKDDYSLDFIKYWRGFFFLFAISTFFGGLSHLLYYYFGLPGKIPGWLTAMLAISSIELAVSSTFEGQKKSNWQYFIYGKMLITAILLAVNFQFTWIMVHTAFGLLGVLGYNSVSDLTQGKSHTRYYIIGVLAMICALPVKVLGFDLHLWFNRDDISHVFMLITNFCFYRGILETLEYSLALSRK